jgi:hypothetical protein
MNQLYIFAFVTIGLLISNIVLSRIDRLSGVPAADRMPWLHKTGSWSVFALIAFLMSTPLIGANVATARLAGWAYVGLVLRVLFLLILRFTINDRERQAAWLLRWNKTALIYAALTILVAANSLEF